MSKKTAQPLIEFDEDGYSTNTAYVIPTAFRAAFGIRMNAQGLWTQGKTRHFERGDTFYDHKSGYTDGWGEALKHIKNIIQVNRIFTDQGKEINDTEYEGEAHSLEIILFKPNLNQTGIERMETRPCSPHQLAKYLLSGNW